MAVAHHQRNTHDRSVSLTCAATPRPFDPFTPRRTTIPAGLPVLASLGKCLVPDGGFPFKYGLPSSSQPRHPFFDQAQSCLSHLHYSEKYSYQQPLDHHISHPTFHHSHFVPSQTSPLSPSQLGSRAPLYIQPCAQTPPSILPPILPPHPSNHLVSRPSTSANRRFVSPP